MDNNTETNIKVKESRQPLTFKQCLIIAVVTVTLFVALMNFKSVIGTVYSLFSYVLPLFIGACFAFVLHIPMKAFERVFAFIQRKCHLKVRHTFNTYLSLVLTLGCVAALIMAFVTYMAPQLADSAVEIAEKVKLFYPNVIKFLNNFGVDTSVAEDLLENFGIEKIITFIKEHISINPDNVVNTVIDAASSTFSVVISAVSSIIFSIYMVTGKKKLNLQARQVVYAYTSKNVADKLCHVGSLVYKTFYNFISSQCLDACVLAGLLFLALRLFNLPYAGIICTLTGVLALIPYVGAFVSCAIGALLILLVDPVKSLIFLIVFFVVQQIEGQLIYPHLVGNSVGLPAIWTLFAALVGGDIMGLFGLITFIPLTAVVYTLIKEGAVKRLKEKEIVVECPVDTEEKEKQRLLKEKKQRKRDKRNAKKQTRYEEKQRKKLVKSLKRQRNKRGFDEDDLDDFDD